MNNDLLKQVIEKVGGDVILPDNLTTTHLKALCETLGVDTSDMKDNLVNSYLKKIITDYKGGSGGITPEGTVEIKTNGTHDVANYVSADVAVPVGVFPSGELEITENGSFDVTNFASVLANVASSGGGGGSCAITSGTFAGTGSTATIDHGLGISPDLVLVLCSSSSTVGGTSTNTAGFFSISDALQEKINLPLKSWSVYPKTTTTVGVEKWGNGLNGSTTRLFSNVNDKSFTVGSGYRTLCDSSYTYTWIAMSGIA